MRNIWKKAAALVLVQSMAFGLATSSPTSTAAQTDPLAMGDAVANHSSSLSTTIDLQVELETTQFSKKLKQKKTAAAGSTSIKDDPMIDELRDQFENAVSSPYSYSLTGNRLLASNLNEDPEDLPSSFDLRDVNGRNYVTPVKFQNPFGTCWGFAAIAAAETSILGNPELVSPDKYDEEYDRMDLSEKHLVYFVNTPYSLLGDSQDGEGTYYPDGMSTQDKLNFGGYPYYATSLFSSGMGPIREDYDESLVYRGENGYIQQRNGIDFCYSKDDNWDLDESLRHVQSYELAETYILPVPAETDEDNHYYYNPEGTRAIKEQLLQKRAVTIGFCADNSRPDQNGEGRYINQNTWAHYTYDEEEVPNHAVTVIGWDDNYSLENFISGHQPPADGAWLVKNSWGSGENEFPNKGLGDWGITETIDGEEVHTGYFWLSYYDMSLVIAEAFRFDLNTDTGYYLSQYDLMPVTEVSSAISSSVISMANVFEAESSCRLRQISCQTVKPGTTVTYEVYALDDEYNDPKDGVKIAEKTSEPYPYGGFHKETLDEEDFLDGQNGHFTIGQKYSIIVTQTLPDGRYALNIMSSFGKKAYDEFISYNWEVGIINPGESFLYLDDNCYDYSDSTLLKSIIGEDYEYFAFDNFPIKAYLDPAARVKVGVDMGEGHGDAAQVLYDYLSSLYEPSDIELLLTNGVVQFLVPAVYTIGSAQTSLNRLVTNVISESDLADDSALTGIGQRALSEYENEEEWQTEFSNATPLPDGYVYLALWSKPIANVKVAVSAPDCGTITTLFRNDSNGWDYATQTNRPAFTISGEHVHPDENSVYGASSAWLASMLPGENAPYIGTLTGNKEFAASICLETDFGYCFTESTSFYVNRKLVDARLNDIEGDSNTVSGSTAILTGKIAVSHHLDDGHAIFESKVNGKKVIQYSCTGCRSTSIVIGLSNNDKPSPVLRYAMKLMRTLSMLNTSHWRWYR